MVFSEPMGVSVGICFVLGLVEKVFSYLNGTLFVSYPVGFFLTFVSKRINLVLGSLGVLEQECTLMNICEICSQLNIFLT